MTFSKKPMTSGKKARGGYTVGYGKPPLHTRFRKGQSSNPGGRAIECARSRSTVRRAKALALEEAYRPVMVADGAGGVAMPAIQAIMRRQIALAMKGNGSVPRPTRRHRRGGGDRGPNVITQQHHAAKIRCCTKQAIMATR